jgi:hypothetical protein
MKTSTALDFLFAYCGFSLSLLLLILLFFPCCLFVCQTCLPFQRIGSFTLDIASAAGMPCDGTRSKASVRCFLWTSRKITPFALAPATSITRRPPSTYRLADQKPFFRVGNSLGGSHPLADLVYRISNYESPRARNMAWRGFMDPRRRDLHQPWSEYATMMAGVFRARYAQRAGIQAWRNY